MKYARYRATIVEVSRTHVEFEAPEDACREALNMGAYNAAEQAEAAHEDSDLDEYPFHWDKATRQKVASVVRICPADDEDDGQPDEAQEWRDFDPDC